jgi:hypothetical protein
LQFLNNNDATKFYTAAVLEYNAPRDQFSSPEDIINANLAAHVNWINEAGRQSADILVFSEGGLNYNGMSDN